jgi:predicted nucleotidyltransferase
MDQKSALEIGRKYLLLLLKRNYPVTRMFLYGSYARGSQNPDSDIDLAIILNEMNDPFQTQVNLLQLTWNFDTRVEPHPFDEKDFTSLNPVSKEILRTGIEISV